MTYADAEFEFEFKGRRYQDAVVGLQALERQLGRSIPNGMQTLKADLRKFLHWTAAEMARRNSGPYPGGTSENSLSRRSGRAVASILASPQVRGTGLNDIEGSVGGAPYLRTHEYGAVIRPKRAKYLTIPLPAALKPNGTPKKARARQWDRTFIMRSKKGNLLIVRRDGRRIVPLYVLKRMVRIPARLGFRAFLGAEVPRFTDFSMARMAERMMRDV